MPRTFPIRRVDVDAPRIRIDESMGSKVKFWLYNPRTKRRVMWKAARTNTGEDWSEKVAYEVSRQLAVPCPRVDLAIMNGEHGVLCWDFLRRRGPPTGSVRASLIHGNELLLERDPDYPKEQYYRVPQHTVDVLCEILSEYDPPQLRIQDRRGIRDAFDAFVGYLLLDALLGNTDRHHENWGVAVVHSRSESRRELAPSYDHASSLGRELSDAKREGRLGSAGKGTVADYAEKAKSAFGDGSPHGKLTPREAFIRAGKLRPEAFRVWYNQLIRTPYAHFADIVDRVPANRLSLTGKRFTKDFLRHNYEQLERLDP